MQDLKDFVWNNYSKSDAVVLADYLNNHPERIIEVINIIKQQEEPLSRRLAWYFSTFFDQAPHKVEPFIDELISFLDQIKIPAIQRCFLRSISRLTIPEQYHAYLLQYSSEVILNAESEIAVKAMAMDIFFQIAKLQPELFYELEQMIDFIYPEGSRGIQNKCRKMTREIEKLRAKS
jgi:hypothetical protein